ncbi:efflux RND transporter periplasmic adaptor subunit [Streptococcus sp. DD12]|uniref:efflux RND transporter periplasmic adaptor subunit n=1 Tax=Streptococcus sp. DD12 TaxID=1777880 RepID=UPI000794C502|nr:efflux RND transporter periplasmic adaptor subunit [Streptococcus sp. DD12]KXT76734.1 periplasmic component of efflux system [Streptococcus sp. DD12]
MFHRRQQTKTKKAQWSLKRKLGFAGGGVVLLFIIWRFLFSGGSSQEAAVTYDLTAVQEGKVTSSTLLSGQVKAQQEQYVYFDTTKGSSASVQVAVGDQVSAGQGLVQYDATAAQAAYDTAVRNVNKISRQITYLKTYGNLPTTETSTNEETGETTTQTIQPSAQQNASYNQQLADLNDSLADAQSEVAKTQDALNQTLVTSDVNGTVVEVNNNVDPSSKESQVMVHVVSQGQYDVKGTLTEFDLPNVHVGQNVTIKSKVYSDKQWTGTISAVSDYPNQTNNTSSSNNSQDNSSTGAAYNYTVAFTSDIGELKQGFNVSLEVANEGQGLVVPVGAVTSEGNKSYVWVYDTKTQTVKKREVSLGGADATNQIITGIDAGTLVLSKASNQLQDGEKINLSDAAKKLVTSQKETAQSATSSSASSASDATESSSPQASDSQETAQGE